MTRRKLYSVLQRTFVSAAIGCAIAAAAPADQAPKLRLGDAVRPMRYNVDLTITPGQDTFSGTLDTNIDVRQPQNVVWLNATDITVKDATLGDRPARVVPGNENVIGFSTGKQIPVGVTPLHIVYEGKISRSSSAGIFQLKEGDRWYVYTQFEPTDARRAFPCLDEPLFKVPWQITLHVPHDLAAFANTSEESQSTEANGMKTVRFAATKPLPSYLVAFAVGPFDTVSAGRDPNGVPLRVIVPKGKANEAKFAAESIPQLLKLLENYFGMPYPYDKLDSIVMPISNFAMENAGLITYGESLLLSKPESDTIARQRECAVVTAHEMAHQWFGDLVTTAWWDDIWLNEAFATWMESKITGEWKPDWHMDVSDVDDRLGAMNLDSLVTARAIRQPIRSENDIANAFDGITYQKGAAVIKMFEHWIGPEKFRQGVQLYLKKNAYGTTTVKQFLAAQSTAAGRDIAPSFSTFLDQPGVPVVTVDLRCDANGPTLALSQRRYLPLGSPAPPPQTWNIPVCAAFQTDGEVKHECDMLTAPAANSRLLVVESKCPKWVDVNDRAVGYYRVAYRGDLLRKLTGDGVPQLSIAERVSLLGDVRALVDSGDTTPQAALSLVPKFSDEPERDIVVGSLDLAGLAVSEFVPDDLLPNGRRYIYDLYGRRAEELGWKSRAGESDDTRLLRDSLVPAVATGAEDQKLIGQAEQLARAWLSDHGAVDADMRSSVLRVAAEFGNRDLFDRMLAAAKAEKDPSSREALLRALGSFRDPELAQAGLDLLLTGDFDFREAFYPLLFGPMRNRATRTLPFEFIEQHVDTLMAKMPREVGADFGAALPRVGQAFCDASGRAKVEAFFKDRVKNFVGGPRELAQTLEAISDCAAEKKVVGPGLAEFLKSK